MMGRYRVVINGFHVQAETWDDALNWDGKHDEVYAVAAVQAWNKDGKVIYSSVPSSPVLGDVNGLPGRIKAGSASKLGGLVTGDSFPTSTPWRRTEVLDDKRNWPPFKVWEGDLVPGQSMVTIAPGLNEWDPGGNALQSWMDWASSLAPKLLEKVKEMVHAGATVSAIVDAVSLGLSMFGEMEKAGLIGSSADRPIGMTPIGNNKFAYNPQVLLLTAENAEAIIASEPAGRGPGVLEIGLVDDPYLRGNYRLYLQVERVDSPGPISPGIDYQITAKHSGRVLDAPGMQTANGTRLQQYDWNGGANQRWLFTPNADGTFTIIGKQSGRAVDAALPATSSSVVQLWDSNGGAQQHWRLVPVEYGFYRIECAATGAVLDVWGINPNNGGEIRVCDWNGGDNQRWRLTPETP